MHFFSKLYQKVLTWSRHPYALRYLAIISFIESSVFPIPPEVMLVSMGLAKPQAIWGNMWIATVGSVLGGALGYAIGSYAGDLLVPYLQYWGYAHHYKIAQTWFHTWGLWGLVGSAFFPIPYKLFTLSAGAMHLAFLPFMLASFASRSIRFSLVSGVLFFGGERLHTLLTHYVDRVILGLIALVGIFYIAYTGIKFGWGQ